MSRKVLAVFDDPGGGLAIIALIRELTQRNIELKIYAGKHNENILRQRRIDHTLIESMITREESQNIMDTVRPDLLLTGTSGGNAEQELRNRAFESKLTSVVVLDFWKDYSRRWMYSDVEIKEITDSVCVMDELTRNEMLEENFPADRLYITGNPFLDEIFQNRDQEEQQPAKDNYLFLSQPLDVIGIKNYDTHPLETFVRGLAKTDRKNITLTVKLHPLEKRSDEIESIIKKYNSETLKIAVPDEKNSLKDLILASEAVIGYNTIAMFEARALNRRTISLNVVKVRNSLTEAMKKAGIEIVKADEESISQSLKKKSIIIPEGNPFEGSIDRCIELITGKLKMN